MKSNNLYQHNSYGSLSGGFYDGTGRLADVLAHGTDGIGTLHQAEGETIILDGVVYQGLADGTVRVADLSETTPYTAVFTQAETLTVSQLTSVPDPTKLYTIRADGLFGFVKVGNKPKQEKPYVRTYAEILAQLPEFTAEAVSGSLVGIYAPDGCEALAGHGFHLHFISDDRTFGGHVLDYRAAADTRFRLAEMTDFLQHFAQ